MQSLVKTCIPVSISLSFFAPSSVTFFFRNNVLIDFKWSLSLRRLLYSRSQTLLYSEHWVFLAMDVSSYYNKDTRKNQNKVVNTQLLKKNKSGPKICRSHCRRHIQRGLLSIWYVFCRCIAEANWKSLKSPLLPTYLATEFQRLIYIYIYIYICIYNIYIYMIYQIMNNCNSLTALNM